MQVCFAETTMGYILTVIEVIIIAVLLYLFIRSIKHLFQQNYMTNYEKLDLTIIFISAILLFLSIFTTIFKLFLFTAFLAITKFSLNTVIQCLLLCIFLWKYSKLTNIIITYFLGIIIILDIIFILFSFLQISPFISTECKSTVETIISVINIVFCLVNFGLYFFYSKNTEIEIEKQILNANDLTKDDDFITEVYHSYDSSIKTMTGSYLKCSFLFFVGFCIDFLFSLKSDKNNVCIYYGHFTEFGIGKLILCFFLFIIRDIMPSLYIYLAFFIFKPQGLSRADSFVEDL